MHFHAAKLTTIAEIVPATSLNGGGAAADDARLLSSVTGLVLESRLLQGTYEFSMSWILAYVLENPLGLVDGLGHFSFAGQ
jgi:hypothetical protein